MTFSSGFCCIPIILAGLKWNGNVFKTFKIHATPTVVVANAETGRHVNLSGENETS